MSVSALFNLVPQWLRKFVGYGVSAGIALMLVVLAFASVPVLRDFLREKLGVPTREDLDTVSERTDAQLAGAIEFTAREVVDRAMRHEHARQDTLFDALSRELIEPGIARLRTVEDQVRALNRQMGINNDQGREQNDRLGQLSRQLEQSSNEAKIDSLLLEVKRLSTAQPQRRIKGNF